MSVTLDTLSMTVSFILCTKNGGARLEPCLSAIEAMDAPDSMELLLVDNGSDDNVSYDLLLRLGQRSRFNCHVLHTATPGNSAGRNVAIARATGELLIFIDDDCYADRRLVRDWVAIFTAQNIGFGSGIIRRFSLEQSNQGCRETTREERVKPYGFVYRGMIQGSNMAFRRECLEAAGSFDERFGAGTPYAGEEWDVAVRACRAGWGGGYFPVPIVDHNHGRRDAETRERDLYYSFGGGAVYAKNFMAPGKLRLIPALLKDFIKVPDWTHRWHLARGFVDFLSSSKTRR